MNYEELLIEADTLGLVTKEKPLRAHNGRIKGQRIAIKQDLTITEKSCVLAEELGHHYTTVGNILNQEDIRNYKQEFRARLWAYNKKIGLQGIIHAYEARRTEPDEMADFLEVTPEFLAEALKCYRSKYSPYTTIDNYIVFFEPCLSVMKVL